VPLVKSPSVFTFGKHISLFLFLAKVVYLLNFFSQVEYLTTSSYCKGAFAQMWPASVPKWLFDLWWAELVNIPDGCPADLFKEASDMVFHRSMEPQLDRKTGTYPQTQISAPTQRKVTERLESERKYGSYREPKKNLHGAYC
jgi:hypothetical protein